MKIVPPILSVLLFFLAGSMQLDAKPVKEKSGKVNPSDALRIDNSKQANENKSQQVYLLDVIQGTLHNQSSILVQREKIRENKGNINISKGPFDWKLGAQGGWTKDINSNYKYPYSGYHGTVTPTFGLSLRKAFSFGPSVEGSVTLKQQEYLKSAFDHYQNFGSNAWYDYKTQNYGRVDFKVNVPILPLIGEKNYAAETVALKLQYKAGLYDLQTKVSEAVYKTVVAYWEYVFAYKRLEILKDACDRSEKILEHTRALAKAGEVPYIEIENARGNLADKINSYYNAEQSLIESRSTLAQAVGIPLGDLDSKIYPGNLFPDIRKDRLDKLLNITELYYETALKNRMELRSMNELIAAADAYVLSARNNVLPDLNVQFGVGYDGSKRGDSIDDFFNSGKKNQPGMDVTAKILFEYPLGNYEARGRLTKTESQLRQLKIQKVQLRNTIKTSVLSSLHNLLNSLKELEKTEDSVKIYMNAFDGERDKFKAGETTLLNIIDIQNRLDNVLINRMSVLKKTATAIVRIRYETGTLIQFSNADGTVNMQELVTVPHMP